MPISSLLVTARKGQTDRVAAALRGLDGVTVTDIDGHNMVVLTETQDRKQDHRIWTQVEATDSVESVHLIYHNFEDLEEQPS